MESLTGVWNEKEKYECITTYQDLLKVNIVSWNLLWRESGMCAYIPGHNKCLSVSHSNKKFENNSIKTFAFEHLSYS